MGQSIEEGDANQYRIIENLGFLDNFSAKINNDSRLRNINEIKELYEEEDLSQSQIFDDK